MQIYMTDNGRLLSAACKNYTQNKDKIKHSPLRHIVWKVRCVPDMMLRWSLPETVPERPRRWESTLPLPSFLCCHFPKRKSVSHNAQAESGASGKGRTLKSGGVDRINRTAAENPRHKYSSYFFGFALFWFGFVSFCAFLYWRAQASKVTPVLK